MEGLDGLPLALATAGAYLNQTAVTWEEYIRLYRQPQRHMYQRSLSSEEQVLYVIWGISYERIGRQSEEAAMLLHLWTYFDNEDLWYNLLRQGHSRGPEWFRALTADETSFNDAVRLLCDYGLVEADTAIEHPAEARGYRMHGCVHRWVKQVLNQPPAADLALLAMTCVGSHVSRNTDRHSRAAQGRLAQHAHRCLATLSEHGISILQGEEWILHRLGDFCSLQGRLADAEDMYKRCLQANGTTQPDMSTLGTLNNLGVFYYNQGRFDEAAIMYERALWGKEAYLGPEHPSTLDTVNNLGCLYYRQGRLNKAMAMYSRALEICEKTLGYDHMSTLEAANNLGAVYYEQDRLQTAMGMYKQAVRGYETRGLEKADSNVSALYASWNMANLYVKLGRVSEAKVLYERYQDACQAVLGVHHEWYQKAAAVLAHLSM